MLHAADIPVSILCCRQQSITRPALGAALVCSSLSWLSLRAQSACQALAGRMITTCSCQLSSVQPRTRIEPQQSGCAVRLEQGDREGGLPCREREMQRAVAAQEKQALRLRAREANTGPPDDADLEWAGLLDAQRSELGCVVTPLINP